MFSLEVDFEFLRKNFNSDKKFLRFLGKKGTKTLTRRVAG